MSSERSMTNGILNPPITFTTVDFDPFIDGELVSAVPATESQKEIWLSVQMGDDANCAYNESQSLRLRGALDVEVLCFALQQLVQRHEALRVHFSPDGTYLCIAKEMAIEISLIDLSTASDRDAEVAILRRQEVERAFDLIHDPLFRATIAQITPTEHLVILTGHHIVCDGWSWGVLLPELAALYSAVKRGELAELEVPERFSEYALSQTQQAQSSEFVNAEQYWLKQFLSEAPALDLPGDRPRPALKTYTARREDWELDSTLVTQLKRVGAKAGSSFFTTLLAGFEVFLYRLTGQNDIVVGTPAAGQSFSGTPGLVGHCVNFLPLRSYVDSQQPFLDYLRARSSEVLDAYEHQQLTFGSLVKKLAIPRDASRVPLVSAVFNYDRALTSKDFPFEGLEAELFSNPRSFENFDLSVNASDANGKLVLECQYNTDLFDATTIRRRMEEFEVLLAGIVADPMQAIAQLPILPTSEKELLQAWNCTQIEYSTETCIHQLFEAQVAQTPDAVAVVFENQQLTYRELNRRANQLANYLKSLGVQPEVMVGICVERSLEMVIGLLGILKAGAAYVPLDPSHPIDRLAYVLEDTAISIVVSQQALIAQLPPSTAQIICLDRDAKAIKKHSPEAPTTEVTSTNLAYVIYTSGSTGKPKGVQLEHRSVVNLLNSVKSQPGLTQRDTLLAVATITFDISVAEIFLPLAVGAQLVIASRSETTDGAKLLKLLKTCGATFFQPTPATWQLLLASGWNGTPQLKMISTGEALSRELANQLLPKGASLWNLYGPTETTIWSATYEVTPGTGLVSIGRPLANTQFYILDQHLQPVPIGVPSELYIGGDGLARGYLNRPELTAERFIPNPQSPTPNPSRLYKTGDLARFLPDGTVECLGRLDYQVKIRGFRIELGEIESVLRQHLEVQETVVVARGSALGDKRLVAYIIPRSPSLTAAELRLFTSRKLPDYMIPSAFVFLEQFPLTSSGKVDRKALPKPEIDRIEPEHEFIAPRDQLEFELARIWETLLGVKPIGITDNFFELGGHSLLAATLLVEIEKAFDKKLPLATMFQAPTIEKLAIILSESGWTPTCPSMVVIQAGTSYPPLFCIHVLGRGLEFYRPMTKYLEPTQSVIGLSVQILDEDEPRPEQVEELATYYIQEIRSLQPEGPYFLSGVSFGGVVAFEMAQQLHLQGQKVALLALMDSYSSVYKRPPLSQRAAQLITLLKQGRTDLLQQKLKLSLLNKIETLQTVYKDVRCKFYQFTKRPIPIQLQDFTYGLENEWALERYTPQPYPGAITFFKSMNRPVHEFESETHDPEFGWRALAEGGIEIFNIPGDHLGMLREPSVQLLGENLRACIAHTQKR